MSALWMFPALEAATSGRAAAPAQPSLLDAVAALERAVAAPEAIQAESRARAEFDQIRQRARSCADAPRGADPIVSTECLLGAIFGPQGMRPADDLAPLTANLALHALASGRGSCDALVTAALIASEDLGIPLEAIVLREHVVLGVPGRADLYFETLEGGRRHAAIELRRHRSPPCGKPGRMRARDYLPYHLDNLAARMASAGRVKDSERALRLALTLDDGIARLHYNYGTLLLGMRRLPEARDHLARAIRRGWDDADAWVNRGVAEWELGRPGDARRSFGRALQKEPAHHRARGNLQAIEDHPPPERPGE